MQVETWYLVVWVVIHEFGGEEGGEEPYLGTYLVVRTYLILEKTG